ncbi:hypothetical protein HY333_00255 [Candidatus Collierbacteria bacterium]|nr:hypothetical protein [Candidatus Collierbacteria bacterium]
MAPFHDEVKALETAFSTIKARIKEAWGLSSDNLYPALVVLTDGDIITVYPLVKYDHVIVRMHTMDINSLLAFEFDRDGLKWEKGPVLVSKWFGFRREEINSADVSSSVAEGDIIEELLPEGDIHYLGFLEYPDGKTKPMFLADFSTNRDPDVDLFRTFAFLLNGNTNIQLGNSRQENK